MRRWTSPNLEASGSLTYHIGPLITSPTRIQDKDGGLLDGSLNF
jgi:hypothetical protein